MSSRTKLLAGSALAVVAVAALIALAADEDGGGSANGCRPDLLSLTPGGDATADFTMGIRVNQAADVDEISRALGKRIETRDIFVVNTTFQGSKPEDWKAVASEIAEKYPCNRLVALNGLGGDERRAGYAFALAGEPGVDAVLADWEQDTYDLAPGRRTWTPKEKVNLARVKAHLSALAKRLPDTSRVGLVPEYIPDWDYGFLGAVIADVNKALGSDGPGFNLVQTQTNCDDPQAPGPGVGELVRKVVSDYPNDAPRSQYGFEIAFSTSAERGASEAVERVDPAEAAICSEQIVKSGGAGILYWATPQALEAMLKTPAGRRLRP